MVFLNLKKKQIETILKRRQYAKFGEKEKMAFEKQHQRNKIKDW